MEHFQRKDVDEKIVKIFVNRLLRFIQSETKDLSMDPEMYKFIKSVDSLAKGIFFNKKQVVYKKHKSFTKALDKLKSNISIENDTYYKKRKLRHIELIERRVKTLKYFSIICEQNINKKVKQQKLDESAKRYKVLQERLASNNIVITNKNKHNTECGYYPPEIDKDSPYVCLCGMDMTFCSENCAFATTLPYPLRTKVYEAEPLVCGGLSGSIACNTGGHGFKTIPYKKPIREVPKVIERQRKEINKYRRKMLSERADY